jgi:hypothetical protein
MRGPRIGIGPGMGGGQSWSSTWNPLNLSELNPVTTGFTTQSVTAIFSGNIGSGISFEYSTDNGANWTVAGTSANGTYNATGLTAGTFYWWRARAYKGTIYGEYAYSTYVQTLALPSYSGGGGSGDRRGIITISSNITFGQGNETFWINGAYANAHNFYTSAQTAAGKYILLDFGTAKIIDEIKWNQEGVYDNGVWKLQGSNTNNGSDWVDIGTTFSFGNPQDTTITEISGNTTAYRYYQMLGVSGNITGSSWSGEIEFKIAGLPQNSVTAPAVLQSQTGGVYDARVYKPNEAVIKDVNLAVSIWGDINGQNDLAVIGAGNEAYYDKQSILLARTSRIGASFTLNRPTEIIIAIRLIYWRNGSVIFDGAVKKTGELWEYGIGDFSLVGESDTANVVQGNSGQLSRINKWKIVKVLFDVSGGWIQAEGAKVAFNSLYDMGGFVLGGVDSFFGVATAEIGDVIVRNKAFTDAEELQVTNYLTNKFIIDQPSDIINLNIVLEGHSFMTFTGSTYTALHILRSINTLKSSVLITAVDGIGITVVGTHAATVDAFIKTETDYLKNIEILYVGCNDLNSGITTADLYTAYKSYVQARVAAGWKMFCYTVTPSPYFESVTIHEADFEADRNTFNALLRNDLALLSDVYVLDTDTVPALADGTSFAFIPDYVHPSFRGSILVKDLFINKLIELYGQKILNV